MKPHEKWRFEEDLAVLGLTIFRERNAQRRPAKYRVQLKAKAQPHLRAAIHWARQTRNALHTGDRATAQMLLDLAWTSLALAETELNDPYLQQGRKQAAAIASLSRKGGKEKAAQRERENSKVLAELDRLIKGCIARGEQYRVKEWLGAYPLKRTAMYERIKRIEEGR